MRSKIPAAIVFLTAMAFAPRAHAQNAAAADALFQKGKEAFDAKRYAEACPAFAESYRLDPVSGSLVALASCYEADGKLASAWSKYGELASLADREGKKERADAARQRVKELEPKLAKLTINVSTDASAISGLAVKRDGTAVGTPSFGTAIPVDRGEHMIEASAPGRLSFSQKVTLQDGATLSVSIPALAASATDPVPPPVDPQGQPANEGTGSGFPFRTVGWLTLGAGVIAMGVGGYFGASAISKKTESIGNGLCDEADNCTVPGANKRFEAQSQGNTSTAFFVVGGILAAGGIVLVVVGGSRSSSNAPSAAISPSVGHDRAGLSLAGRFW